MAKDLVPVTFHKIMQSRSYTVIIMAAPEKKFAIYTEPLVGQNIQMQLAEESHPRPLTYDLIGSIFAGFEIELLQVVIQDVEDTVYFARLFLEKKVGDERHIVEIDARPSDCVTLALKYNAPVFCRQAVLDKAVAVEE